MPYPVGSIATNPTSPTPEDDHTVFAPSNPTETWAPPIDVMEDAPPPPPELPSQPKPPSDGGAPDAGGDGPTPDGRDGPPPDNSPRVPQQVGIWMGGDVSVTVVSNLFSGGGGTVGVAAGIGSDGPYIYGYNTPPNAGSAGLSVGMTAGVSVTVGAPTSGPSNVVGGSVGPVGGSVSHTPGANGGPGAAGATVGFSFGPTGGFVTQTEPHYLLGGEGPPEPTEAKPALDGGQCIEGDLDGDGHLSEEELKKLSENEC